MFTKLGAALALALTTTGATAATVQHSISGYADIMDPRYAEYEYGDLLEADPTLGTLTGVRVDLSALFTLWIIDYDGPEAHWATGCAALEFLQTGGLEACGSTFQGEFYDPGPEVQMNAADSFLYTSPSYLDEVLAGGLLFDYRAVGENAGGEVSFRGTVTFFYDEPPVGATVPLPATAILLLGGLASLAMTSGLRRRRHSGPMA